MKNIGNCWWDLDENMNIVIECEQPLIGKHYLLTIHHPKKGMGCAEDAADIAQEIVDFLNSKDKTK